MPSSPEERLRVSAVISALKEAGIRVKNWKSFLSDPAAAHGPAPRQEGRCSAFAFGRGLVSLPQCHLPEVGGCVPKFLVDACEFLSLHLHTEGLFRKTGSLSRIRSLRAALEQGEPIFRPPLADALQPCDVATLLKQFLRELPTPLIPSELQGPLCRAQGLETQGFQDGDRDRMVLLVTALFPASNARALRYFCTFLRNTAGRCSENRMEVGNLALVIAPNLLHCPPGGSKLTVDTGRLVDRQAEVVKVLIIHADRIGIVPSEILDAVSSVPEPGSITPLTDGVVFQDRATLGVYRSLRRQRRRSVGEMFVEALSKLKSGRTPNGHSQHSDGMMGQHISTTSQSSSTAKRKSTEDAVPELEGSAKKRRSIHDLREDKSNSQSCTDESESTLSQSPTPSLSSVLSVMEGSDEHEPLVPSCMSGKKRSQNANNKKSQRYPSQENREERRRRRRRSLRFFTLTSWSSPSTAAPPEYEDDSWLRSSRKVTGSTSDPVSSDGAVPFRIPFILIEGPGRAVVGSEVEDDADLLNCSFTEETPNYLRTGASATLAEEVESRRLVEEAGGEAEPQSGTNDREARVCHTLTGTRGDMEIENAVGEPGVDDQGSNRVDAGKRSPGVPWQSEDIMRRVSRPPRRSISLPDVTAGPVGRQGEEDEEEEEGSRRFTSADFHDYDCPAPDSTGDGGRQPWTCGGAVVTQGKAGVEKNEYQTSELEPSVEAEKNEKAGEVVAVADAVNMALKKSSQRMSVADHVRRFNMLTAWLRAPRGPSVHPPPQKSTIPQEVQQASGPRGPVRLRRQGARRFSRSISHERVSVLLQGNSIKQQPFQELVGPRKPRDFFQNHRQLTPHPLQAQSHHHQCRQRQQQRGSRESGAEKHSYQERSGESLRLQEAGRRHHCAESPMQLPEQESPTEEMDLHRLLERQLHLNQSEPGEEPEVRLHSQSHVDKPKNTQHSSFIPPQQEPLEVRTLSLLSPATLLPHGTDVHLDKGPSRKVFSSTHVSQTPPPEFGSCPTPHTRPHADFLLESDAPFDYTPPLSADDTVDMGFKGITDNSISPPAMQFQAPATRRRYRDSPRWPISDIRIATWDPVLL